MQNAQDQIIELLTPMVAPMGYEIVYVEIQNHRQKTLRLFIDRVDGTGIKIEDCVAVAKTLDEPLDQMEQIEAMFKGSYELEVSSPGVDRPLRVSKDYEKFKGKQARIHIFRPLTAEEIENSDYLQKNPKQKNFMGTLEGVQNGKVLLALTAGAAESTKEKKKKPARQSSNKNSVEKVSIPLPLISKANLEPIFEFDSESEIEL